MPMKPFSSKKTEKIPVKKSYGLEKRKIPNYGSLKQILRMKKQEVEKWPQANKNTWWLCRRV